jgi:sporulation protein YlmC with PRC-barrel domain
MQRSDVWLATALLNARVRNNLGDNLGKIEDITIDPATGDLEYAFISFGGVLGMGDKLFPVPWTALSFSPSRDYVLLDADRESLRDAPGFAPDAWPNTADPVWRRRVNDYYPSARPVEPARTVYVERHHEPARAGMSVFGGILVACLGLALVWLTFLVASRGWDQAREDIRSSFQGAVYAAKQTSHDTALTTKVKTALALSKRVPSDKIDVDSDGDTVTLRGEVPTNDTRELVESIARDVPGVSEVQNHLFVVGQ